MSSCDSSQLHLQWIKKHPQFVPLDGVSKFHPTYYAEMVAFYEMMMKKPLFVKYDLAKTYFDDDIKLCNSITARLHEYENEVLKDAPRAWFITLNFDDQSFTPEKANAIVNKILSFDWVFSCLAVMEFHKTGGFHYHVHMYITCNITKSKVLEKLFATKGIKQLIKKKNFIDCKEGFPEHKLYVQGIKQDSKEELVKLDREMRKRYSIPEIYIK